MTIKIVIAESLDRKEQAEALGVSMHEFIILLLLGSPIACAVVAEKKGRSGIAWFVVGAMIPILSLIALLLLENRKKHS